MSQDRNKTGLTHDVTSATARWLDERGFKPVETEVWLGSRWIADLAAVICPTQTELIDLKLLDRAPTWNERRSGLREWQEGQYAEWREKRNGLLRMMTCAVEVKTSRADFRGDRKWVVAQPTDLAYLAVPRGLIRQEEWPHGWGILEFHDGSVKRLRPPTPKLVSSEQQRDVVYNIAERRDHHTRYERHREWAKQERVEQAQRTSITRVSEAVRFVLGVVRGDQPSFERHLHLYPDIAKTLNETSTAQLKILHNVRPLTAEERRAAEQEALESFGRMDRIRKERLERIKNGE